MFSEEDVKKQLFKGAFLDTPKQLPMYLRIREPIRTDSIPDDEEYEALRQTVRDLIAFQKYASTFCVHSEFWKALVEHAKVCVVMKLFSRKTKEDMKRVFNLPREYEQIDAFVLYWHIFSPHAAAVNDIGLGVYFPVHPILSLSGPVFVWSPNKHSKTRCQFSFFYFLRRRLFLKGECPDNTKLGRIEY